MPVTPWSETALRLGAMAAAAGAVAAVHAAGVPTLACPWRSVTGLPCPLCGATTAAVALAHLDVPGALAASPLALAGAAAVAALPVLRPRADRLPARLRAGLVVVLLCASEVWQLVRLDVV